MRRRRLGWAFGLLVLGCGGLLGSPNPVSYVAKAAVFEAELLWRRVPLEQAAASGRLGPDELDRLRRVPEIQAWAADRVGLAHTDNYRTVSLGWDRVIWNVSGCEPLAFEPRTWWFPIVGRVPYLGFFDETQARRQADRLAADGLDVRVRTAGTFSSLGWFRDPLLPAMLRWDEDRLADTVVHEGVHATLWIPGSAQFNESFANFVGEQAAVAWLAHRYGQDSPEVADARRRDADGHRYRRLLTGVVAELRAVYADPAATDDQKRRRKAEILASLPARGAGAGFEAPERWVAALSEPDWNNARLLQFSVYNRGWEGFEALFEAEDRDLARLITRVARLAEAGGDPWAALARASGVPDGSVSGS